MTVADLEQSVRGSLRQAGLLQYVDEEETQFLEFPEGWFAEIALKDGSKVPDVENIVRRFKIDLQREQAVELDEIVRPVWKLTKIERVGSSVSFPGLEQAVRFIAALESGSLTCAVRIDVTEAALGVIHEKLSKTQVPEDAALREVVGEFLKTQLSHGGSRHWDPRRESRLELDAAALTYLFGLRDAYERLKQSIDEIFNPTIIGVRKKIIESFVRSMSYAHGARKVRRFQDALTDLPAASGGAYSARQKFATNYEFYELLLDEEKRDLEAYYLDQVAKAEKDFPDFKSQYSVVFD